jgi:hypothetical protein
LTPRTMRARASSLKRISLAAMGITPDMGVGDWG